MNRKPKTSATNFEIIRGTSSREETLGFISPKRQSRKSIGKGSEVLPSGKEMTSIHVKKGTEMK